MSNLSVWSWIWIGLTILVIAGTILRIINVNTLSKAE